MKFLTTLQKWIGYLALVLALMVVVFGAYVRLSDAGLGCPDWPGCYGQLTVPDASQTLSHPRPLDPYKAWKEMGHRYLAGTLGLLILFNAILSVVCKKERKLSFILLGLVIFQALLGMWTVTLSLYPPVVTAHLLGGFLTLAALWILCLKVHIRWKVTIEPPKALFKLALAGLILLLVQISLGGWVSSNYAAFACTDFPTCRGSYWPSMNLEEGFHFLKEIGPDYEFGVISDLGRVAVHYVHRIGAVVVFVYFWFLGFWVWRKSPEPRLQNIGGLLILEVTLQLLLGIANVVLVRPLEIAVLHNLMAALLFSTSLTLVYGAKQKPIYV